MDLKLSDKSQYLYQSAILLKALEGGIRLLWIHIYMTYLSVRNISYMNESVTSKLLSELFSNNICSKTSLCLFDTAQYKQQRGPRWHEAVV